MQATEKQAVTHQKQVIENRSIDWVPLSERRGKPKSLFFLWFMSNANITTLASGMLGIALGGTFITTMLAILAGAAVGTIFTAFHSAQGPQLGLPQMIQSRAQFGYIGVALVCAIVVFSLVGFNMFNQILGGEIIAKVTGNHNNWIWYLLISLLALTLAIFGYDMIHKTQTVLTWLFLATFGVLTVLSLLFAPLPADEFSLVNMNIAAFLVQFGAAAAYALGWAPYVSDYSRYLPPETKPKKALFFTYAGIVTGMSWLMILGAYIAANFREDNPVTGVYIWVQALLPGLGNLILLLALPALVAVITVNIYAAAMEIITIADSIKPIKPTLTVRILAAATVATIAYLGAAFSSGDFLDNFGSFLVVLLYILVPWTSVNLVDYFFVRKGVYAITEIFDPNGIYGKWGWRGQLSYLIGLIAMVPFVVTQWYVGPIAEALNEADIALFVGVLTSGISYWLLGKTLDLEAEKQIASAAARNTGMLAVAYGAQKD